MTGRGVLIVLFDGVQSLDVTGPLEVFNGASRAQADVGAPGYRITTASLGGAPVTTSSGLGLIPAADLRSMRLAGADTLIVPGGRGTARPDPELIGWLRARGPAAGRITSVCTGAFLLAAAGLLDGKSATTHWAYADALARQYPAVTVQPDPIFVRDGHVATSAGVTAGIDLALALVEEDLGHAAALEVARNLVVYLRRPGGQAQFSAHLKAQSAQRAPLRDVQQWISEHPADDLSVAGPGRAGGPVAPAVRARVRRRDRDVAGPVRQHGAAGDRPPDARGLRPRRLPGLARLRVRHTRGHAPRLRRSHSEYRQPATATGSDHPTFP